MRSLLSNEEAFAAAKILLESRALMKAEMFPILEKMVSCCVPYENQRHINEMIANEKISLCGAAPSNAAFREIVADFSGNKEAAGAANNLLQEERL